MSAIRRDLVRLHAGWMGLAFHQQYVSAHPVMGVQRPESVGGRVRYRLWSALGVAVLLVGYPLAVLGFATRFYVDQMSGFAKRVGTIGLVVTGVLLWGGLTLSAYLRDFSTTGVAAVAAAGGVAIVSTLLARLFARVGGRGTTILLAYPFGVTAILLPPVAAAFFSPALAQVVFTRSTVLAIWILDSILVVGGINTVLRNTFELAGLAYLAMWFAIAVPVGWALGLLVALADGIRPKERGTGQGTQPN